MERDISKKALMGDLEGKINIFLFTGDKQRILLEEYSYIEIKRLIWWDIVNKNKLHIKIDCLAVSALSNNLAKVSDC